MPCWICATCGTQYKRQYVKHEGQRWTTLHQMQQQGYNNIIEAECPGLTAIYTSPKFPIGQRALLIHTPHGNVLWDCVTFIDAATVEKVKHDFGGIAAIVISHPHYYTSMVEWAESFQCPIMLHARDEQHVMRPSQSIRFIQEDEQQIVEGVTALRLGGHFTGSLVLHCSLPTVERPFLCTGDTIMVVPDQNPKAWVSFMYSYPNLIPLPSKEVARMRDQLAAWKFDKIYGAFKGQHVEAGAWDAVMRSADRYVGILDGNITRDFY
ncbi:hypothetical protein WJX74_008422 [Apatococcus lobatus]|uniref:Metallo-beta-lactamase domain-containing protein n=1 Tax=Apatococcus lobatus TaxID=904363 RepID=A0AAW1SAU4_9CHLO